MSIALYVIVFAMQTNKILRNIIVAGIFFLPFICLIVYTHFFFPFITGKNFTFRIIVEVIACLWVILALRDQTALPKSTRILQAFAVFVGLLFVSDLGSPNVYKSFWSNYERMEGWVTLAHLFTLFVVMSSVMTRKLWERLFRISIVASLILFGYGCLQLMGQLDIHQGATRIDTTIGNSAYLGGYMLFNIFLALYMLVGYLKSNYGTKSWGYFWPIFYGFAILADTFILIMTATRGAEIGLIVGLSCFAGGLAFFDKEGTKFSKRAGAGVLIAVGLLGGAFVFARNTDFVTKSQSLSRMGSFVDQLLTFDKKVICEGELKSRCLLWPMSFQGVKERPVFGWGQESFNYVFNKYYDPRMYSQEQWFDRTHNVFFDWLIAGGILGLLAYLSLFGFALHYLWKKGSSFSALESSVLTGLLVGYFLHNFTVFDNITSYILFVMVLSYISSTSGKVSETLASEIKSLDSGLKNQILIPIVAIITILIVYKVNVPPMLASYELISALSGQAGGPAVNLEHYKKALSYESLGDSEIREQLVQVTSQAANNQGIDPKIRNDFFELTKEQVKIQLARTPEDARYFLFSGSFLSSFGDSEGAIRDLTTAHKLSPNKQTILFTLGSAHLSKRDYKSAVAVMKQAYELAPAFDEARKIYALALVYDRQLSVAEELLKSYDAASIVGDQRFIIAYYTSGYYEKALEGLNYVISKDPNNAQLYFSRASVEVPLGRRNAAIADLNKVIELNPGAKSQVDPIIEQVRAGKSI